MRYCKLRQKEVVTVIEGCSLGYINDLVIDECTGRICAIVVPGNCGIRALFKTVSYVIPWENICKIGNDVLLVEVDLGTCTVTGSE